LWTGASPGENDGDSRGTVTSKKDQGNHPKKSSPAGPGKFDARRKHRHWEVTILYQDGKHFSRVYIDQERAQRFADRQKKSPVVRSAKVREVY
jgi:hypothetical protein